jgi:hypothetical protein
MLGLKRYFEEQAKALVEDLVRALAHLGTPTVFVIPESNLAEWYLEESADAPWFSQDGNERWFRYLAQAREALRREDLPEAEINAQRMVRLDHGVAASGLRILAECKRRAKANTESRSLYETARDSHIWDALLESPRPLAVVQETLRQGLSREGIPFVDLARVFDEWAGGSLPDRRFFLDYCHLTAEGIRIAMGATAQHVVKLLGGDAPTLDELVTIAPTCSREVEGEARFAAAIHCAHFGQPYDIVHHCCLKAVEASGERLASIMVAYMEVATRRAPSWMCSAAERMAETETSCLHRYLRGAGELKLVDRVLFEAIVDVLRLAGTDRREWLLNLRCGEHAVAPGRRVNLLDRFYAPSWRHRDWVAWIWDRKRRYHYYRACESISAFSFICNLDDPISVRLTCRLVDSVEGKEPCVLSANGMELQSFSPTTTWATWTFSIPSDALQRGINSLEVHWPTKTIRGEEGIERAARDFERGLAPRLVPAFAAIHSLTATVAAEPVSEPDMSGVMKP